jgi:radical SAM superfamily enzyme YgiQ (UPF0313 family)
MRLLLIQPPSSDPLMDQVYVFEPLALEYLGAAAKLDGHEVAVIDARFDPDVERAALEFQPDLIGLTAFTSHVNIVKAMAARLKTLCPNAFFVIGGHHATVSPHDFNGNEFDAVVTGEGVAALRDILQALAGDGELSAIRGLGLPAPEGMRFTDPRLYTDLDALPFPDRSLTARYRHRYASEWLKPLASIRTSLGCTARCTFCSLWSITSGKYLRREPDAVVAELSAIDEPNVFFCDDESMCDASRMAVLAGKIRAAGIKKRYFLYARADTIVRHPDLFAEWAGIGLSQVFVGMEDFSEARLAAMKKGISTEQQEKAVRIMDDLGVMVYASFMVDPDYTRDDFRALVAYIRKLKLKHANFSILTPLPGTQLYAARDGELLSRKPELFDMLHALLPTRLPLAEFYEEVARLFTNAIPIHRSLPLLLKFGLHGAVLRLRLITAFLKKVRTSHLDYCDS